MKLASSGDNRQSGKHKLSLVCETSSIAHAERSGGPAVWAVATRSEELRGSLRRRVHRGSEYENHYYCDKEEKYKGQKRSKEEEYGVYNWRLE